MSVRLTGALVAALALLAALPAVAAADLSRSAQRVYDDYRSDAAIRPCDHSITTYRRTLREITPDIEEETPAFRPAVEAALREREKSTGDCAAPGDDQQDANAGAGDQTAPPATQNPAPAAPAPAKPAPALPAQPAPTPPGQPNTQATPQPTPTPTVAPAPPVTSSAPAPATAPVLLDRPHQGTPVGLWIALGLLGVCLLAALLALLTRHSDRFAGARHAWGEAAYRAGGTWGDFVDWMRLGRQ